jgi:hypothetical protein
MVPSHTVNGIASYHKYVKKCPLFLLVINVACSSPQAIFFIATLKVQNLGKGNILG